MPISVVDLFSGAGGVTYGFEQAGLDTAVALDKNPDCRYPIESNTSAEFRQCRIQPLARNPETVASMFPFGADATVLAGCVPCQPYSTLNNGNEAAEHDDWELFHDFRRIVRGVEPDIVVTENVYEVTGHEIFDQFLETLEDLGYHINDEKRVYCPEYGIPQKRKRCVVLASKLGSLELGPPEYVDEAEFPTVREAIDHLPSLEAGETHPDRRLHTARTLNETNLERIRLMEPGADWRIWEEKGREDLMLDCHRRASGESFKAPYSRMRPDEPAPTITTQFYNYGSGRFGHYDTDQDRALSLLEGAVLQTFPEDYRFVSDTDELKVKNLGRLIGNAVPPRLAEHVGYRIREHVAAADGTNVAAPADD
jgi:DNA (cytosine-5)-methyltransferase 1